MKEKLGFAPDPLQCRVLDTDARQGMLNCTRQWGKSTVTAAKAVHQAWREKGSLTIVINPTSRQSGEFVRKAATFLRKLKAPVRGDGDNEMSLALTNGSRIVGLPGSEATIRGFSAASLLLIDEASRVSDEVYKAVRPMIATSDGALWLMSTPYGKRGFFYEEWKNGGPEWKRVAVKATECPRIPASFLEKERKRAINEQWFAQEYLCEFGEPPGPKARRPRVMNRLHMHSFSEV